MQFVHNLHFYCAYFTVTTSTCFPELLFLREIHPPMKQDFCSDTTLMGLVLLNVQNTQFIKKPTTGNHVKLEMKCCLSYKPVPNKDLDLFLQIGCIKT